MISERTFVSSFSGFWEELLPLLTPKFVHLFNDGFRRNLNDDGGREVHEVPRVAESDSDPAFIAEFAYYLARVAAEHGIDTDLAFGDEEKRAVAERDALAAVDSRQSLAQASPQPRVAVPLTSNELSEAQALARNYTYFFEHLKAPGKQVYFQYPVPGAGFISTCYADLIVASSIFEIKTVTRNLGRRDIRQLFVYLALQSQTEEQRWRTGGFFNPRRATFFEFEVDEFVPLISGGKSSVESFRELLEFVSSRDIQIDSIF